MFCYIFVQFVFALENSVYSSTAPEKYSVHYYPDRENKRFTVHYSTCKKYKTQALQEFEKTILGGVREALRTLLLGPPEGKKTSGRTHKNEEETVSKCYNKHSN